MDNFFIFYVDKTKIEHFKLSKDIGYFDYGLLHFYLNEDRWHLHLKNGLIDNSEEVILHMGVYKINNEDTFYDSKLFVYKSDEAYDKFTILPNRPFIISKHPESTVIVNDELLDGYYLFYEDERIKTNSHYVYLNGKLYDGEILNDFDLIEFIGIKFIYHHNFIYLNKFNNRTKKRYKLHFNTYIYPLISSINNYIKPQYLGDLSNELAIYDYQEIKKKTFPSLIEQLGPGLTMSLAMCLVAYLNVQNSLNRGSEIREVIPMLLVPVVTLASTLLWPIIIRLIYRFKYWQKKRQYDIKYQKDLASAIDEYLLKFYSRIEILNDYYFDYKKYQKMKDNNTYFYLVESDGYFLNISLGTFSYKINFDRAYPFIEIFKDKLIVDDYPLLIDIKKKKNIIIRESIKDDYYAINRLILELSLTNDFNDYLLVLYKVPEKLRHFEFIPAIFNEDKRYLLREENELAELLEIDKKIVIVSFDQIEIQKRDNFYYIIYQNSEYLDYKNINTIIYFDNCKGRIVSDNESLLFTYPREEFDYETLFYKERKYLNLDIFKVENYQFKDLYKEDIKDIDILKRHSFNKYGLKANFALFDTGISFDLHERGLGPHGLIGGTTGSGKSELIISLLFSLCLNYSPDYLNIVIIDYKGGGIVQSLSYQSKTLPHIIASISNLDNNNFERLLVGIKKECDRRQIEFNNLSSDTDEAIMNIDDYNMHSESKLSRLLIVVDEFAELKKSHPEQMKELISLSRIGRSLGLHLLLATQKPSVSIDDEIWSNSRFKIALKVQDEKDSRELIKNNLAAFIKKPGEFYLLLDQKLYAGKSIYLRSPLDTYNAKVALLDERLNIVAESSNTTKNMLNVLDYGVKRICLLYNNHQIKKLFSFKPLSHTSSELVEKYEYSKGDLEIILGEIDDYENLYQNILTYQIKFNHLLIVTKNDEYIYSILKDLISSNMRIIYIGSKEIIHPFISDTLKYWDEDLLFLLKKLARQNKRQNLIIIFEDLNVFLNYEEEYKYYFYHLLSISQIIGIRFIAMVKTSNNLPYKALLGFENIISIGTKDKSELMTLFKTPLDIDNDYCLMDKIYPFVPVKAHVQKFSARIVEHYINKMPTVIKAKIRNNQILLGIDINEREELYHDVSSSLVIVSNSKKDLALYQKSYGKFTNISFMEYAKNSLSNTNILWIGKGVYKQNLFYPLETDDLNDDEAYYLCGNKKIKIRIINE